MSMIKEENGKFLSGEQVSINNTDYTDLPNNKKGKLLKKKTSQKASQNIKQKKSKAKSVEDKADSESKVDIPEDQVIVCDGLVKIYKTDQVEVMALQGLDFKVKKGEMLAMIGKSGCGKSTLMNMLGGLERPTAGKVYVQGRSLFARTDQELENYRRQTVGFVWQKSGRNLFPYLTALENVEAPMYFTPGKTDREWAMQLLEMVGMGDKMNSYPDQLSGGQQQRVAIAVALANKPDILLADEPTGAVDAMTGDLLKELFKKLNKDLGITILIVTHDNTFAKHVDRVVLMSDGKIAQEKAGEEEYSVLDNARRLQLDEDMLKEAGIDSNKVRVNVVDGQIIITSTENKE